MKKITLLSFFFFTLGNITHVSAQTLTTYSVLSTSYDRSTGAFFPIGSVDNYWFFTEIQNLVVPLNPASLVSHPNDPTYVVTNSGNNTFPGMINDHSINFANNTNSPGSKLITYRTYFNIPNLTSHGYELDFTISLELTNLTC